jgi:hypothetical protein
MTIELPVPMHDVSGGTINSVYSCLENIKIDLENSRGHTPWRNETDIKFIDDTITNVLELVDKHRRACKHELEARIAAN